MTGRCISLLAISISLSSRIALADDPADGAVVKVDARYVFVPIGFDDNDETLAVVDGFLPSGCYRLTDPDVNVDQATKTVTITPKARYFNVPCIEALVPYHFEAKFGQLAAGDYTVSVTGARVQLNETLPVHHTMFAGPDDFLYAPVDNAVVERDVFSGRLTATLTGRFTNTCIAWSEVRIEDNGKTINVLPIIDFSDSADCQPTEIPFKKSVELPASVLPGRHLLHVRSLNGKAVNYLFYKPY